jgi:integrase/recombinase XerD
VQFLRHLKETGYSRRTLRGRAPVLLEIATNTTLLSLETVAKGELRCQILNSLASDANGNRKDYRVSYLTRVATQWLDFLSKLKSSESSKLEEIRDHFPILTQYLGSRERDSGCSIASIVNYKRNAADFLIWLRSKDRDLGQLTLPVVDEYLKFKGSTCARRSMATYVSQLKSFLEYCEVNGRYQGSLAKFLHGPRVYSLENIPQGPSWDAVKRLLAEPDLRTKRGIRDRAILLLLAVYGLRSSEVVGLKLDDIDWSQDIVKVYRSKNRRHQTFPLTSEVGEAIVAYLEKARPKSAQREIFLTMTTPIGPLVPSSAANITKKYYQQAKIETPHMGAHSLRHACATNLLSNSLSLKEIGDHLGHRGSGAAQTYAKVELNSLRQVAELGLGGLT